jgi:glucose/arabinose dehydrogenase
VKPRLLALAGAVAVLVLCAGAASHASSLAGTASVRLSVPAANRAAPFDAPRAVSIPAGWRAAVWARVPGARYALWTPRHTLLVTASGSGQVLELTPRAARAAVPAARVLASGLSFPQGLAFDTLGGRTVLYVAETNEVDRYAWNANGTLGARTVVVKSLPDADPTGDDVHRSKGIAVGPDHRIYVTVGSAWNANGADTTRNPPRGAIYSYASNGTGMKVFATGVRNGEGLAFAPDGALWVAVNERDNVPYPFHQAYGGFPDAYGKVVQSYVDENPTEEVARLTPGRNLGWPFCNPTADVKPGHPEAGLDFEHPRFVPDVQNNPTGQALDCTKLAPIERPIPAHSAPVSLTFLQGSTLPARWRAGALVGAHGSWNRTPPRPPGILWFPWSAAAHTLGAPTTLVGGFQDASGGRWGRPVDAVPGGDGALYVTDDQAGAVYRLTPPGVK